MTTEKSEKRSPVHVAIIPDGNRRWAKQNNLPSLAGHKKSVENFEKLLDTAKDLGIKYVTAWAFSTENWKRSEDEIKYLFGLIAEFVDKYREICIKNKIRFLHIGRKDRISKEILQKITQTEEETKDYTFMHLAVGLDYGGHDEMLRTIDKIMKKGQEVTKETIEENLDTALMPPPDLIIRTGGEVRLSGFMSWQSAYSEYYFTDLYFPDFGPAQLKQAIEEYVNRDRRFGGNSKVTYAS